MRRKVDHSDLAAAGYFSNWSLTPGTAAAFRLSTADPAAVLRVIRLDRPATPARDWRIRRSPAPLEIQELDLGATLTLEIAADLRAQDDWALDFEFRLTDAPNDRALVACAGFTLGFDTAGALQFTAGSSAGASGEPLPIGHWLMCTLTGRGGAVEARVRRFESDTVLMHIRIETASVLPREIHIGKAMIEAGPTLNVAIGRVTLRVGQHAMAWRFPPVGRPETLSPEDAEGARLRIRNAPTFAVRSPRWDGTCLDPQQAPAHYDAVQLHDDDLADANWPVIHAIDVPEDAGSGIYGVEIATAGQITRWPFFVTAVRPSAALVFLVPSFTYLAYANERLPPELYPWRGDDAGHRFARANNLTSLYDVHNDGSGVSLASFRRPLATIREDYLYPLCGTPHLLPIDLHLLRFLAAQNLPVDILTDAELHRDGAARLAGYRGLITGSHPEYWSSAMLNAAESFQTRGGHIAYLGGNGCYWVTASDGRGIEVRRGTRGIRTWSSEPGENCLAITGEAGGLWRDRGHAEHRLLGVGLAAMGFTQARPFHRTPESYATELAWLFEGVGDQPIGDSGLMLGGASGYEIDCRSAAWGTPDITTLLAIAEGFDRGYEPDPDGKVPDLPPIRGEMTLTRIGSGAITFAAGSVSWCGALPEPDAMNPVGRITANLLRRFLA